MILKDKIYKFEIFYCENGVANKVKNVYSDSDNLYDLEDVPQKAHHIYCYYKSLKADNNWQCQDAYIIGEEITKEEAREEIEKLKGLGTSDLKTITLNALKDFCNNEFNDRIFINKNVDIDKSIAGRLIMGSWWPENSLISPSQIVDGKIYPVGQVKSGEIEDDKSYTALE